MRHYRKIHSLMKVVMENKVQRGGFPMAAIMFNQSGEIIGEPKTNIRKSDISKEKSDHHGHHAEQLIKEMKGSLPKKFILISLLPPCNKCLESISDEAKEIKIYYLTDSIRRRFQSKEYNEKLNNIKTDVIMEYLDVHKRWWNRIKIYYWYIIANLLHSSLNHKGVDKESLRGEIDELISNIEKKIKKVKAGKEITFIKGDLPFLKTNKEWRK